MTDTATRISSWTFGDARTNHGQLVTFGAPRDQLDSVRSALEQATYVELPETQSTNVVHGGLGRYTRYHIEQLKYAGGSGGYIEAIVVTDAPGDRIGFIVHQYGAYDGSKFWEYRGRKSIEAAFEKCWGGGGREEQLPKQRGFVRYVDCHGLVPWFYAVGHQALIGDFAFPDHFQDHPYYRAGRQFVVPGEGGKQAVLTCIGSRRLELGQSRYASHEGRLQVYWSDGTCTLVDDNQRDRDDTQRPKHAPKFPRAREDGEAWVADAMSRFRTALLGARECFSIAFLDGTEFTGSFSPGNPSLLVTAGEYNVAIQFTDDQPPRSGWFTFAPTAEAPNVLSFLLSRLSNIAVVEVLEVKVGGKPRKNGRGLFYALPINTD